MTTYNTTGTCQPFNIVQFMIKETTVWFTCERPYLLCIIFSQSPVLFEALLFVDLHVTTLLLGFWEVLQMKLKHVSILQSCLYQNAVNSYSNKIGLNSCFYCTHQYDNRIMNIVLLGLGTSGFYCWNDA